MVTDLQRAVDLASRLALAYPGRQIDEGHVVSWAELLTRYDESVVAMAIERLRENFPSPPSAADVLEELQDVQASHRPALAEGELWGGSSDPIPMSDEVRTTIREMLDRWHDDTDDVPAQDWEAVKGATLSGPRLKDGCSAVVGEPTVMRNGHAYCPSCGEDLCPSCPPEVRVG
jgi:hypothetical protein